MRHPNPNIAARGSEVLHLIASEYSSKQISEKSYVSVEAIYSHYENVRSKLCAKNVVGMIRVAFERGLLQSGTYASPLSIVQA